MIRVAVVMNKDCQAADGELVRRDGHIAMILRSQFDGTVGVVEVTSSRPVSQTLRSNARVVNLKMKNISLD
jgi:hypothetical protein